ncbi:helix-turn-helix domain-containing protein [Stieleria sp. JC731]|uniref:helix-turn-helix domain-containing protein n=1 Tax=Pirellulaceae TaxID=2691357 RepID=UPI000B95D42C|nr:MULTISPECIES: helix-turn-helix domain-containing protein [Pirellulaceae]MCC9601015.1 helix-turn-helix domain-containing protein [Stieleria sp. JC731]OYP37219.1 DNA-binding protein [Rhodopirellula sp. MGV]PNY34152.1 DNA-binding protein [Rhodopirellula baltica]
MQDQATDDCVLTIEELAAYLKVSKSTLYKLVQEGSVPGQKVGRHWRFRRETIDRWLDSNDGGSTKPR